VRIDRHRGLREAIARAGKGAKPSTWDLGKDLFGKVASGNPRLSRMRARELIPGRRRARTAA
jgi:hypothetical protein